MTTKTFAEKFDDLTIIAEVIEPLFKAIDSRVDPDDDTPDYEHDLGSDGICERCGCENYVLTHCPGEWFEYNGNEDFVNGEWV